MSGEPWRDDLRSITRLLKEDVPAAQARVEALLRAQPTLRDRFALWREWHRKLPRQLAEEERASLQRAALDGIPREAALQECLDLGAAGGLDATLAFNFLAPLTGPADVARVLDVALAAARSPKEDVHGGARYILQRLADVDPPRLAAVAERLLQAAPARDFDTGILLARTPAGRHLLPLALERIRARLPKAAPVTGRMLVGNVAWLLPPTPTRDEAAAVAATLRAIDDDASLPPDLRRVAGDQLRQAEGAR